MGATWMIVTFINEMHIIYLIRQQDIANVPQIGEEWMQRPEKWEKIKSDGQW